MGGPLTSDELRRVIEREMGTLMREGDEIRATLAHTEAERAALLDETNRLNESLHRVVAQVALPTLRDSFRILKTIRIKSTCMHAQCTQFCFWGVC